MTWQTGAFIHVIWGSETEARKVDVMRYATEGTLFTATILESHVSPYGGGGPMVQRVRLLSPKSSNLWLPVAWFRAPAGQVFMAFAEEDTCQS